MAFKELLSRTVSVAQSKYKIEEKHVTQQSSYNLDLALMRTLLDDKVITLTHDNHYELSEEYRLELGKGIVDLIGPSWEMDNDQAKVIFIFTEASDGTKKFQIKRKENKTDAYSWFAKLYDKNFEGSKFKVYLDTEAKILKFDNVPPVNIDEVEYDLIDTDEDLSLDYLSKKLVKYYDSISPKHTGVHMFGIDYCSEFEKNPDLEKQIIIKSGLSVSYQRELHEGICIAKELRNRKDKKTSTISTSPQRYKYIGYNKILYGIPGCGKSYKVDQFLKQNKVKQENIIRTTFYLDYSNSDFVGQIIPKVEDNKVIYESIPGPFTKALFQAMQSEEMVYLIIEEINRGNAAAIFGDLFQLLDRKKYDDQFGFQGSSEYPISNEFIESYFEKNLPDYKRKPIIIPNNMTIIATMNTSDQNVFPLDTAFKRRWDMEKVSDNDSICDFDDYYIPFTDITWKMFREEINKKITEISRDGVISEDKKLGKFFAKKEMFDEPTINDIITRLNEQEKIKLDKRRKQSLKKFEYNIMDYIYNDVCKFDKDGWFNNDDSFDDICQLIDEYANDDFQGDKNLGLILFNK